MEYFSTLNKYIISCLFFYFVYFFYIFILGISINKIEMKLTKTRTRTKTRTTTKTNKTKIKMCSNILKCKYPHICNLCYEQHKTNEFIDIEFHPCFHKGNVLKCTNCTEPIFYDGKEKVSRKVLNDIKKRKPEIYKNIVWEHCAYSKCGKKLPLLLTSSNSVKFEICHKCLPNMNELLVNHITDSNNIGNCNTCKYEDSIFAMHKKCYDYFITANSENK